MELYHLKAFLAVAEEQNITRAAKRLDSTPSAISMQIKALEASLRLTLFTRNTRGVELTSEGQTILPAVQQVVQAAQHLLNTAESLRQDQSQQVTVGLNASVNFLRVPALATQVSRHHATVQLQVVNLSSRQVLEGVSSGTLDMGFVFGQGYEATVAVQPLTLARLVVAVPMAWCEQISEATWQTMAQLPWIFSDGYCPFQEIVDTLFRERGLTYERVVQAGDETTKRSLVVAGVGIALLEWSEAQEAAAYGQLVIWETPPIYSPLGLAYQKNLTSAARLVRDEILRLWHT